ncbi:conserved hypothetical protein [Theileria orientalis strain Shintoku]|uniref:Uncharacterized protein n=1 Tax=Theileria orientalis strain Shintoku TaxID=869250 RepID=J4DQ58_THEOR|nr:conserved hypothetical protein [Theileria orientalis strain Shintoku]BAM41879.1 conserved hypothetical protein [Theileria orientalis strain Shintoku]|eukprot:XP_009692180.1 conserved hypothetical protein [Theileria orientalis strain Shintoku]
MTQEKTDNRCKIIAAFVSLSSHLIMHQIDVTSAHFAVAFNIPLSNISIYFSKLFSFRCLLIAVGSASEFIVACVCSHLGSSESGNSGQGKGSSDKGTNGKCRKYISMGCFGLVLVMRLLFLCILHFASRLGYFLYIVLSIEAFFFGYFHCSVLAIAPEYSVPVVFAANASRIFVLSLQFVLDLCIKSNALINIKIQTWVYVILTSIAVALWIYCYASEDLTGSNHDSSASTTSQTGDQTSDKKDFFGTLTKAYSPFSMFFAGSMFKDFLFPGVLPYAVLHRDKCHIINMLVPIANMIGPISLYTLESIKSFKKWETQFDCFWVLVIPMLGIFICSMMAIHKKNSRANLIINSKKLVLIITIMLILCNSYLDPLSFGGVAKTVKPQSESEGAEKKSNNKKRGDDSVITFHLILALFMRFIFSKLSVGYNDTRVSLGYHLPKFRPNHKMPKSNIGWYFIRETFRRAWRDTGSDFKMNIKEYL